MTVFQAAGDESDGEKQRGAFVYGGYVARTLEWIESFAPAWEERVLNANPSIPYLHMVDMRSPKWRAKHGITYDQAERRIDEASRVLGSSGFLHPVRTILDGGVFRDVFGETRGCPARNATRHISI